MLLLKNPAPLVLLVVTVLAGTVLGVRAVNTEPIIRQLSQFSFDDQESSAAWGRAVMDVRKKFDAGDEGAKDLVQSLYKAWKGHFATELGMEKQDVSDEIEAFIGNLWSVAETNVENFRGYPKNEQKWWQSMNKFANLNFDEFKRNYLMPEIRKPDFSFEDFEIDPLTKLRTCVNWSSTDQLTPVKNQGACGSCWAFSAVAAEESNYLIRNGKTYSSNPIDLSEQQLVDCVSAPRTDTSGAAYRSGGCSGGRSPEAFDFIRKYGVYKESKYPYTATSGSCTLDFPRSMELKGKAPNPGWGRLSPSSDPGAIRTALNRQTLSHYIRVEAPFQLYNGGIFSAPCTGSGVNHATLFYGYCDWFVSAQSKFALDHFFIKNSWGTGWGENGKMRIATTAGDGVCESQKYAWVENAAAWRFHL
jgi:hypothetical protein